MQPLAREAYYQPLAFPWVHYLRQTASPDKGNRSELVGTVRT